MAVIRLQGVGVAWSTSTPVLEDVELSLEPGFYGLVGANGSGKTTLLSILADHFKPHEGKVLVRPRTARIAYCPQGVADQGADVGCFAQRLDGQAVEIRGRLELDPRELERWETLSPGQRKRWQVAAALGAEPDVLLLDEPTNHLDAESRGGLLSALSRFSGVGVVVSHDREVLDRLTQMTLRVHDRGVSLYPGPYGTASALWRSQRREAEQAHASQLSRIRKAAAQVACARRAQESTARGMSTRRRMKNPNDSDARGIGPTSLANWADKKAGRAVKLANGELARARSSLSSISRDVTLGSQIFAQYERAPHSTLFHLDQDALKLGDHVVLRDVRLSVGREERLRIRGANGSGKTTLLNALLASRAPKERVLYLPQELAPSDVRALSQRLADCDREGRSRLLSIFAALGSDASRVLGAQAAQRLALCSPGELRKLMLAEALARQVWALVLDEPTNHLDLPSIERLEAALAQYPGCVVLVTHDDAFARSVTQVEIHVAAGTVR